MKWSSLVLFLGFLGVVVAELPLAKPCDPSVCKLPACRCSSTAIPGGLAPRHTPQFVMITFDDAVNILNIDTYRSSLYNRTNRNGCKAGATFYVNHEYTNYQLVNELYNHGFEIALHTISHKTPSSAWANATVETLRREIADQILQMAHFANVSSADVHGVRLPFLQMSGNSSFVVMQESGLSYDCSWPTMSFTNPGLWPYSLNYASTQDCIIPPCPTASIPRTWVLPMLSWRDLNGLPCSMADSCYATPPFDDENAWFKFIVTNFERQYKGNRAPFGFFVHEWFLRIHPAVYRAFTRFLNMINSLSDVFMVNSKEVLDWVRNPVPINEYLKKPCRTRPYRSCAANTCGPLASPHLPERHYWMVLCNKCPREYPWVGNPLGV